MEGIIAKEQKLNLLRRPGKPTSFDLYNKDDAFRPIRENLNERRYTVGEAPVSYRVINHWANSDLLPHGVKDTTGWKKFSFVEIVWLHAAKQMRDFGLSLERIATARNCVMIWDARCERYPGFEFFLAEAMSSPADPYIVIFGDNHVMLARAEQIEQQKILFGSRHMVLVSLKAILKDVAGANAVKDADASFLLSDNEKVLLAELRTDNVDEVKAKIKDGTITEIETGSTATGIDSHSTASKEMRASGAYGRVTLQFEEGVPKSAQRFRRRRLGK